MIVKIVRVAFYCCTYQISQLDTIQIHKIDFQSFKFWFFPFILLGLSKSDGFLLFLLFFSTTKKSFHGKSWCNFFSTSSINHHFLTWLALSGTQKTVLRYNINLDQVLKCLLNMIGISIVAMNGFWCCNL